jgi:hypothetical protein
MPHIPGHAVSATEPLPQALAPLAALRPYHWFWTVCPGYHAEDGAAGLVQVAHWTVTVGIIWILGSL